MPITRLVDVHPSLLEAVCEEHQHLLQTLQGFSMILEDRKRLVEELRELLEPEAWESKTALAKELHVLLNS